MHMLSRSTEVRLRHGVLALGRSPEMYDDVHEAVREALADFENVVTD